MPYQDSAESGRLILRDGAAAEIRMAQPEDCEAMMMFSQRCRASLNGGDFLVLADPLKNS
jgi:hypothetical protein